MEEGERMMQSWSGSTAAPQGAEGVDFDTDSDGEDGGERAGRMLRSKTSTPPDISSSPRAADALPDLLMAKVRGWPWWPARPGTGAARSFVPEGKTRVQEP